MNNFSSLLGDNDDASLSEPLSLAYLLDDDEEIDVEEEEEIPSCCSVWPLSTTRASSMIEPAFHGKIVLQFYNMRTCLLKHIACLCQHSTIWFKSFIQEFALASRRP